MNYPKRLFHLLFWMFFFCQATYSWETAIAGVLTSPPSQGLDGRIYSTADDRALHCLNSVTGREYWSFRPGRKLNGFTIVSPDGSILIRTVQNVLVSVSPGGRELWRYELSGRLMLEPAADPHGTLFLLYENRSLEVLDRTGRLIKEFSLERTPTEYFAGNNELFLLYSDQLEIMDLQGNISGALPCLPDKILWIDGQYYMQDQTGGWWLFNRNTIALVESVSPIGPETEYPEAHTLITREGQIVSGRKDWFMEALESGADSFHPLYQYGSNPGRNRGLEVLPEDAAADKKPHGFWSLLLMDERLLNDTLKVYENMETAQELLARDSRYIQNFSDLLADGQVVSFDVNRSVLNSHSRFRIYRILCRWGILKGRNALLTFSSSEEDPHNLMLIMDGLGKIGLDTDGRSMNALRRIAVRHPGHPEILVSAVQNAALLAKYNGGGAVSEMMLFYQSLQNEAMPVQVNRAIRKEMRSF